MWVTSGTSEMCSEFNVFHITKKREECFTVPFEVPVFKPAAIHFKYRFLSDSIQTAYGVYIEEGLM